MMSIPKKEILRYVGTAVYVINNHKTLKWLPGATKQITSPASILIKLSDGLMVLPQTYCVRSTQDYHDSNLNTDITPSSPYPFTLQHRQFHAILQGFKGHQIIILQLKGSIVVCNQLF